MNTLVRAAGLWLVPLLMAGPGACKNDAGAPSAPSVGTNSNWLRACAPDDPCGDPPECRCGACTLTCTSDADCDALADARCALDQDLASAAQCGGGGVPTGICLPRCTPGSCDIGQACVAEACLLAALPDLPFCDPVVDRDAQQRTLEDELLALVQEQRTRGGASCGGTGPTAPAPGLRFDARLLCAARVLAADLSLSGALSTVDSEGRATEVRLAAAGFQPSLWAEGFAIDGASAADALALIVADAASCMRLSDPALTSVGVGSADGVVVVTLGTE